MNQQNPCETVWNEIFKNFGYPTGEPCDVCGAKPARTEPRFHYAVCIDHFNFSPVRISNLIQERKNNDREGEMV